MKQILVSVSVSNNSQSSSGTEEDVQFPIAYAIILILSPIIQSYCEANGHRVFIHLAGQTNSAVCSLIFAKALEVDTCISQQSDEGQSFSSGALLTMASTDSRNVGTNIPLFIQMMWLPLQLIVPLIFLATELGVTTIVCAVVVGIAVVLQGFVGTQASRAIKRYLQENDSRNKTTDETLKVIKLVKCGGYESVFAKRIEKLRNVQLKYVGLISLFQQIGVSVGVVAPLA
ncbi:MAG: hypothetical protein EZS28_036259, partial [Streblomastix strix]